MGDTGTRRVRRVSTTSAGAHASALHPCTADEFADAYVTDLRSGVVDLVSAASTGEEPAGALLAFAMSPDGRHVAFATDAANVVPGTPTAGATSSCDDRSDGRTVEASAGDPSHELGSPDGDVAAGGRAVAFTSYSRTLVPGDANGAADVFVRTP